MPVGRSRHTYVEVLFTKVRGRGVRRTPSLRSSRKFPPLAQGSVRDGRRLHVVVDACRRQKPAPAALVDRNPRLRRNLAIPPSHAVVLDGAPNPVVGEGAVI